MDEYRVGVATAYVERKFVPRCRQKFLRHTNNSHIQYVPSRLYTTPTEANGAELDSRAINIHHNERSSTQVTPQSVATAKCANTQKKKGRK